MKNRIVLVRAQAGLFVGELTAYANAEADLKNVRRLWYWTGAASLSQLVQEGNHLRGGMGRASRNGVCRKEGGLGGEWGGHTHQSVTSLQHRQLYVCTPRPNPHPRLKNAHTRTLLATISPPVWSSRP